MADLGSEMRDFWKDKLSPSASPSAPAAEVVAAPAAGNDLASEMRDFWKDKGVNLPERPTAASEATTDVTPGSSSLPGTAVASEPPARTPEIEAAKYETKPEVEAVTPEPIPTFPGPKAPPAPPAPLPQAIAPSPAVTTAPAPPVEAAPAEQIPTFGSRDTAQPPPVNAPVLDKWLGDHLVTPAEKVGRWAVNFDRPTIEMLHGLTRGTEKTINLALGQSPDWTWQNSPTGAMTELTGWMLKQVPPELGPKADEWASKWSSDLLGGLAAYMIVPKVAAVAGAPLPMPGPAGIFGKGIAAADRVTAIGQSLATNLLNFGIVDVSRALGQGGDLDAAREALKGSMETAAVFTIAGALPWEKVVSNPWLVKSLESASTGTAFAGSQALQGETDPMKLLASFLTGFGLHALTSGGPMALGYLGDKMDAKAAGEARQKYLDETFNGAVIDWAKTNQIKEDQLGRMMDLLNEIAQREPVGETAPPETGPQVLGPNGEPISAAQRTMQDPEVAAALAKPSWARNAQEKLLADQVERQATAQPPVLPPGVRPGTIIPGEANARPRANFGEETIDALQRSADLAGAKGKELSGFLGNNRETLLNAFSTTGDIPGLPEITNEILRLQKQVDAGADPGPLNDYLRANMGALKGLPRWPVVGGPELTPAAPPEKVASPENPIGVGGDEVATAATTPEVAKSATTEAKYSERELEAGITDEGVEIPLEATKPTIPDLDKMSPAELEKFANMSDAELEDLAAKLRAAGINKFSLRERSAGKELWEMTRDEYFDSRPPSYWDKNFAPITEPRYKSVEKALRSGMTVSPEVLAEYSDLADKYVPQTPQETSAPVTPEAKADPFLERLKAIRQEAAARAAGAAVIPGGFSPNAAVPGTPGWNEFIASGQKPAKAKAPKAPEAPVQPVSNVGDATADAGRKPAPLPPGVRESLDKWGTAGKTGAPKGLLSEGPEGSIDLVATGYQPASTAPGSLPSYSRFPTERLETQPEVFQHKRAADLETGSVGSLEGVKWQEARAGELGVFETIDGRFIVAHGHNRFWLANRDQIPTLKIKVYREADGWTPARVKHEAFMDNLADGKLDALDIGQFLRETGATEADLKGWISLKSKDAQNGLGLAGLSPRIWDDVYQGKWGHYGDELSAEKGAALGGHLKDNPVAQEAIYKRLQELQGEGKEYSVAAIRQMAEAGRLAVVTQESQGLFGDTEADVSRVVERGVLTAYLNKELGTAKNALIAANRHQERLEAAGNTIKPEENKRIANEAKEILNGFGKFKSVAGSETDRVLNDYAEKLAQARTTGEENAIKQDAITAIHSSLQADAQNFGIGGAQGRPESGPMAQGAGPGNAGRQEIPLKPSPFSLKEDGSLTLQPIGRPLTKFEKRLNAILDEYPDSDAEKVNQTLRSQPQATDEQIALMAKVDPEVANKMAAGTTAAAMRAKEAARRAPTQEALFGGGSGGPAGGLFDQTTPEVPKADPVEKVTAPPINPKEIGIERTALLDFGTYSEGVRNWAREYYNNPNLEWNDAWLKTLKADHRHAFNTAVLEGWPVNPKNVEAYPDALALKKNKPVLQEQANAQESAPAATAAEPDNRPGGLSEDGARRQGELADFQSRRSADPARNPAEDHIFDALKTSSDEFANSRSFRAIAAEARGRGIKQVLPVAGDANFESVLVPEGDGSHSLLISERVDRGTHEQLAGHEFFHHDVENEHGKATDLVRTVNPDAPAYKAYAETLNRLRENAGLAPLEARDMAIEVAADFASGLSRRSVDGQDIDLKDAFHAVGEQALANYRGEILPGSALDKVMGGKQTVRPPNPGERVTYDGNRPGTVTGTETHGGNVWVNIQDDATGMIYRRHGLKVELTGGETNPLYAGAKVVKLSTGETGTIRQVRPLSAEMQQFHPDGAKNYLDVKWNGNKSGWRPRVDLNVKDTEIAFKNSGQGPVTSSTTAARDEFSHLRTAPAEETGKINRFETQKSLFSLATPEQRQGWIDISEPMTFKQFEAKLAENDGALERQIKDPASKLIPLYQGERYIGTRAGDWIADAKGKQVQLSNRDIWERINDPKEPTLPPGTETARPEDFLGSPAKPGPEGTIEAPSRNTALRSLRKKTSAASLSEKAEQTQGSIIKNAGWAAREMVEKGKILDTYRDAFANLGRDMLPAYTDAVETYGPDAKVMIDPKTGAEVPIPPELQEAAKVWRRLDDGQHALRTYMKEEAAEEARQSGQKVADPMVAYWENHFPRLFKDSERVAVPAIRAYIGKSLTGPESFNKVRTQLLFSDSIKPKLEVRTGESGGFDVVQQNLYDGTEKVVENFASKDQADQMVKEKGGLGLEPLTDNYADMMKGALWEQLRYSFGKMIEGDLKDMGFITRKPTGGYERYQGDKTLEGYYIHPDVAAVMDNFFSKGMRGDPLFELYNGPATFINTVLVGLSAFHATLSTFSSLAVGVGSNLTRAVGAAFTGRFDLAGHHLAELAKAGNIPLEVIKGGRMLKEYESPGAFPEWSDLVDLMAKGGIRSTSRTFMETVKAVWSTGQVDTTEMGMISRAFNEVYRDGQLGLPRRLMDVIAHPIMTYLVPRLKIASTAKMLQMHLDEAVNKGLKLTEQEQVKLAQDCARKADNIFGQMVYDNLSMTRGLRDALRIFIGFPGWNIGSGTDIMQGMKGITHLVGEGGKAAAELMTGRKPSYEAMSRQNRMSLEFYLGTMVVVSVFGALTQRLLTGEWPQTIKDLMMPQTGALMSNGQPERVRPPTYLRDVLALNHPVEMIKHKLNWPLRMFSALTDNQDFFGEQIRNPYDSAGQQTLDTVKYIGHSLMPFGLQGYQATEDPKAKALNLIGITKVPRVYSNSDAMNVIDEYNKLNRSTMTTKEQGAQKRLKTDLRQLAQAGDEDGFRAAAQTAMEQGNLTHEQIKGIVDQSQAPPGIERFVGLPIEWQLRALAEASPQEKQLWEPYLLKKVMSAKPEILVRNREALAPVLEQMGYDDTAAKIRGMEIPSAATTPMDLSGLGIRKPSPEISNVDAADVSMADKIAANLSKIGAPKKPAPAVSKKKPSPYGVLGF